MVDDLMQRMLDATTVIVDNDENVVASDEARSKHTRVPLVEFVLRAGSRAEAF